jgi:hypothetical protein
MSHRFDSRKKAQKENIKVALNVLADGLVSRDPCLVARLPRQVAGKDSSDESRATSNNISSVTDKRQMPFAYVAVRP